MFKRFLYIVCDKVSRNCGSVMEFENDATLSRWFKLMVSSGAVPDHFLRDSFIYRVGEISILNGVPSCRSCQPEIVLRGDDFIDSAPEADFDSSDCDAV